MEKSFLKEALRYADMGLSVIPIIPGQKKPMIKWQQYQKTRADSDTDKNANEDANAGRAYSDTHEDLDTDAREHSHAYTNGNAGWLDAGCVYNPLLGGKPGLHPRLAPNRGGLVR